MKIFTKLFLILSLLLSVFILQSCTSDDVETSNMKDIINPDYDIAYYYWLTCPHCVELNKYFEENDIYDKVEFEKKEIFVNTTNAKEFSTVISMLGLDPATVWVPFMYEKTTKEHFIGGNTIIEFIESKISETDNETESK